MPMTIYIDNNNVIKLLSVTNSITGAADTGATVTVTLKDSAGENVSGQTWPATMAHASGGTYRATLDADLVLQQNRKYTAHIGAIGSGGEIGHWELQLAAATRGG